MGHIQRRGKERWRARYIAPDGKERNKTFRRKVDAERFLASVEVGKFRGEWIDPKLSNMTFGEWADQWRSTVVHLKPKTKVGYDSLLRRQLLPAFGHFPLIAITTVRVKGWVAELVNRGMSWSRVRQAYQLLSMVLGAAVEDGYLARTPCVGVKIARTPQRETVVLTAEEVQALAEAITGPHGTLVYVLAYGGLRWGEACALRRRRCDLVRSRLEVVESLAEASGELHFGATKTYANRWARLPRFVSEMLGEHLAREVPNDSNALVFTAGGGAPLRNSNFRRRVWAPALRAAGLPESLRIHDLRHTCASLLIRHGASVKAVQQQLGHSTPTVTLNVYSHLFDDDLDRLYEGIDEGYRLLSSATRTASRRPAADFSTLPPPSDDAETLMPQGF
jgi:integrase